jgi:hypothetical protein
MKTKQPDADYGDCNNWREIRMRPNCLNGWMISYGNHHFNVPNRELDSFFAIIGGVSRLTESKVLASLPSDEEEEE